MEKRIAYLVDDDQAVRTSVQLLLESEGIEVHSYASGDVLLRGAAPDEHSCLIIDVDMPGISGVDLLDRLRRRGIDNPAIMITGAAVGSSLLSAIRRRANARLLQKPFSPSELLSAIRIALGYCWICCVVAIDLAV